MSVVVESGTVRHRSIKAERQNHRLAKRDDPHRIDAVPMDAEYPDHQFEIDRRPADTVVEKRQVRLISPKT